MALFCNTRKTGELMPEEENCLQLEYWGVFCPGRRHVVLPHGCQEPAKLLDKWKLNNTQMRRTASAQGVRGASAVGVNKVPCLRNEYKPSSVSWSSRIVSLLAE